MNWLTLFNLFGGPIGSLVNKALGAGGAALASWAIAKGAPVETTQVVVGSLMTAASAIIGAVTHTQSAKIASINDTENGVKVVRGDVAAPMVTRPLK